MAGIDRITEEILQEAKDKSNAIIKKATDEADEIKATAEKEAAQKTEEAWTKTQKKVKDYQDRIQSQIGLENRQQILSVKQKVISQMIEEAYQTLADQDNDRYFSMLLKLLKKAVRQEKGELFLSKKDLERLPDDFEKRIAEIAKGKNGELTLSKKAAAIENGFVLSYGGIDENCTLMALFDEKRNLLQDEVHQILW